MENNCYKCQERYVGCHGKCEKYKAYKVELEKENEKRREEQLEGIRNYERRMNFKRHKVDMVDKGFTRTKK